MVEPIDIGLHTIPYTFCQQLNQSMPLIGGHKTISSLLHLGGSSSGSKVDGRTAFSPYTGSLSGGGGPATRSGQQAAAMAGSLDPGPPSVNLGTSITLHVRYVAKDMWRKVTFPPGITVTQARDICMLRFNIWQQTLAEGAPDHEDRSSTDQKPPSGTAMGMAGAAPSIASQRSQTEFREQYGLFWTSAGHWLETDEMLHSYALRKGEVLELQHIVDFIPLQPDEFKHSYAEAHMHYYLAADNKDEWQMGWAVLRNRRLAVFGQKGGKEAALEIDLTGLFRLTDQDGRSWPRQSELPALPLGFLETLPPVAAPAGPGGGVLAIQQPASAHFLRTTNPFDYEAWHRALRQTLQSGAEDMAGGIAAGCGVSATSGTSAASHRSQEAQEALSPQLRARISSTRHEGEANRKAPDGYGFRRRYCVVTRKTLFGFMHSRDGRESREAEALMDKCEFAVSLDPSTVTVEAIPWNGRYLLRVFGPQGQLLKDRPPATALPSEGERIQCTDILATAAEAAIEQFGSTFGLLPDSRELVRLMIDDHDEGQAWAAAFNAVAGLQITGQSKVIVSARTASLSEPKSQSQSQPQAQLRSPSSNRHCSAVEPDQRSVSTVSSASPVVCRQQSLSEFIVSQIDPLANVHATQPPAVPAMPAMPAMPVGEASGPQEPKWIPLNIDKYMKEEAETKDRRLNSKPSITSDHTTTEGLSQQFRPGYTSASTSTRSPPPPPPRFNWFKRRGSTSK